MLCWEAVCDCRSVLASDHTHQSAVETLLLYHHLPFPAAHTHREREYHEHYICIVEVLKCPQSNITLYILRWQLMMLTSTFWHIGSGTRVRWQRLWPHSSPPTSFILTHVHDVCMQASKPLGWPIHCVTYFTQEKTLWPLLMQYIHGWQHIPQWEFGRVLIDYHRTWNESCQVEIPAVQQCSTHSWVSHTSLIKWLV